MTRFLTRLFGKPEEINGADRCPTYLYRWIVLKWRGRGIYIHHFVADDWSIDLHDHPRRFISIGLRGGYVESNSGTYVRYNAPWFRTFPANYKHRLIMIRDKDTNAKRDCWTLVIVLKPSRDWGFWPRGKFVHWKEYVKSTRADEAKSCGD
jgi:hypothetical protein